MTYTDVREDDLTNMVTCNDCCAVIDYWDRNKHDLWHKKIEHHGHSYAAAYGPGGQWDVTGSMRPARADHECNYDDPRQCEWPGHRR